MKRETGEVIFLQQAPGYTAEIPLSIFDTKIPDEFDFVVNNREANQYTVHYRRIGVSLQYERV